MKRIVSAVTIAIGVLGTIATVYTMPDGFAHNAFVMALSMLALIGLFSLLSQEVDLLSAWSVLRQSKRLGIRRINDTGHGNSNCSQMANAKNIRIMAVSGNAVIKSRKSEIISALRNQKAFIRILLAQPNSQFVSDVESAESLHRMGQISPEISGVEKLLHEYVAEAASGKGAEEIGKVKIGHYSTQLRTSLILCDESWGWLTLNLAPKRAMQCVSLELSRVDNGLMVDCINHFDKCWEIVEQRNQAFQILLT